MYVSYEEYEQNGGTMPKDAFPAMETRAEAYIRFLTYLNGDVFAVENEAVKQAVCAAADVYYSAQKQLSSGQTGPVKSENNDGYSVTYVTEQTDGQTAEETIRKKAYAAVYPYLLPTGWLSRKVRCGHAHKCRYNDLQCGL